MKTNRRSFFNRIAQAVAIVALAPRLAFGVKDEKFALPSISEFGKGNPVKEVSDEAQKAFVMAFFFNQPIPQHLHQGVPVEVHYNLKEGTRTIKLSDLVIE